ncbi:gamma-glutamylcyclotransferase family protein [Legionella rowbothamii]|uniref:gamma-glutamylcyclotransferase family protein n=1 Tax=Legionella rowbothamii TaxID=96229 RepID=UPI001055E287|nr:gamma-glutamylcyclotransferase family protein [Legionella rowbothamii]
MEKLFCYGTLQYESVQLASFGRKLAGAPDSLLEFELFLLTISDPVIVAISGEADHPVIRYTGRTSDKVAGMVFELTPEELKQADLYEVADYKRIKVQLESGMFAWVYVGADVGE